MFKNKAMQIVILFGCVSLLADVTYEGARSITGPYLYILGASAALVSFVGGLGELVAYGLRIVSGYMTERSGKYWLITIVGYTVNLISVPLLALAGHWGIAMALIVAERMGKAIRSPARDAMLSCATKEIGHGWGFGLHEAMDQIGAVSGPLIVASVLYWKSDYRLGFAVLLIPAIVCLCILGITWKIYKSPKELEVKRITLESHGYVRSYWIYLIAVSLFAAGYVNFPLISFHLKTKAIASDAWIPIFYTIAMGVDAFSALLFGKLYDKFGFSVLIISSLIVTPITPLVFLGGYWTVVIAMVAWGIGMGAQESIMRAAVATLVPPEKRGSAFGLFHGGYGLFWFLGSTLMGVLYEKSLVCLIGFSVFMELVSIPVFILLIKSHDNKNTGEVIHE